MTSHQAIGLSARAQLKAVPMSILQISDPPKQTPDPKAYHASRRRGAAFAENPTQRD
jgi:hypothetical protein